MAKWNGRWVIVNVLWETKPEKKWVEADSSSRIIKREDDPRIHTRITLISTSLRVVSCGFVDESFPSSDSKCSKEILADERHLRAAFGTKPGRAFRLMPAASAG